ncbi:MAG TPA: heavy metal-binding domain-containing protein [Candidatus Acidoferrales bacterium]|nr:heavy metal-binding domain-containing protein [Candidatus Acidoferrales bacterium]
MKTTLMIALAAVMAGGIPWVAPYCLSAADSTSANHKILHYTCPMHPSVKSDKPGDCPVCGMNLAPVYANPVGDGTNTPPAVTNTNTSTATGRGCCGSGGCH